ncbi:MAG: glycoside hydrolase family 1 protein [Candidatus Doudnabacteria bacterium]|nr:glycoside hydrolase family 1 protein [Candidatus Doudnabacteria bacterium]
MREKKLVFPKGFLWGSAVSAHQTEGNNIYSDWWEWENSQRRAGELEALPQDPSLFRSGAACDFYHRYEQDFDLVSALHQNAFRLSLEWARMEPKQGFYDEQAWDHYRKVLQSLKKRNVKTFVTLHHFTLPAWFAHQGGFERAENTGKFVNFAQTAAQKLGEDVDFWLTINEPEIYSSHAYLFGRYPPQKKSWAAMYRVVKNLIWAHNQAVRAIKQVSSKPVGMSYHRIDLLPRSIFSKFLRDLVHYVNNEYILRRTINACDFVGINYYGHSHIGFFGRHAHTQEHHEVNDLGWGIHPEGLERVLVGLKKYHKPIYVTENGLADAKDEKRERFIRDHLYYVHRAMERGADVRGYLHWSLLDNFEWAHGFSPRFGLVQVDYPSQERTIRASAYQYAEICRTNQLTLP